MSSRMMPPKPGADPGIIVSPISNPDPSPFTSNLKGIDTRRTDLN